MFRRFCTKFILRKKLLNMFTAFGLNILNGVCNGDLQGRYTFISNCENSVTDSFMVSEDFSFSYSEWLSALCDGKNRVRPFTVGIAYKCWRNDRTCSTSRQKLIYFKICMETDQRGWMNGTMKSVGLLEKNVRKWLRKFRKSLNCAESVDYCCARREYKKLLQQKRRSSMKMCWTILCSQY